MRPGWCFTKRSAARIAAVAGALMVLPGSGNAQLPSPNPVPGFAIPDVTPRLPAPGTQAWIDQIANDPLAAPREPGRILEWQASNVLLPLFDNLYLRDLRRQFGLAQLQNRPGNGPYQDGPGLAAALIHADDVDPFTFKDWERIFWSDKMPRACAWAPARFSTIGASSTGTSAAMKRLSKTSTRRASGW